MMPVSGVQEDFSSQQKGTQMREQRGTLLSLLLHHAGVVLPGARVSPKMACSVIQ